MLFLITKIERDFYLELLIKKELHRTVNHTQQTTIFLKKYNNELMNFIGLFLVTSCRVGRDLIPSPVP